MLVLLVRAADQLYCIRAASVVEVVPRVPLQPVPHAPSALAGLLHFRSEVIPVIDLRALVAGSASEALLSTRIAVIECGTGSPTRPDGRVETPPHRRFGLIAERVTEALQIAESEIEPAPVTLESSRWLGGVLVHDGQLVRELLVDRFDVQEAVA
jgi:chemotaxis-related protein WspB